jgi:hypothetical protein
MPRDLSVGCAGPDVKELQGLLSFPTAATCFARLSGTSDIATGRARKHSGMPPAPHRGFYRRIVHGCR